MKLLSHAGLLATPWTAAYQSPPSMGFSRQEYWSGVPLPSLMRIHMHRQISHIPLVHTQIYTYKPHKHTYMTTQHMITWNTEKHINWDNISISTSLSVQFSHSVMSDSLWPHELQHARLPCPSPTPRAYSNSWLSWWCHPTISFSVIPLSSHLHLSQHQGLFQWVSSLHQVAKVLMLQYQSFQWIFRTDFL